MTEERKQQILKDKDDIIARFAPNDPAEDEDKTCISCQ